MYERIVVAVLCVTSPSTFRESALWKAQCQPAWRKTMISRTSSRCVFCCADEDDDDVDTDATCDICVLTLIGAFFCVEQDY